MEQDRQSAGEHNELLADAERILDDVDHALRRIDEGSYGRCEACGAEIDEDRLVRYPAARTCAQHPQLTDPA
jgi:DnaK suppressor protein